VIEYECGGDKYVCNWRENPRVYTETQSERDNILLESDDKKNNAVESL
jgi:hypothetical protein